ncbi:hypothetical protein B0T14DRAFT_191495 [Immersiella caudata]|uniref:Arrestin C-terminal-like domain-containing protein n=1 Tax=Immersiella caudata TaxID=314043 RepID=A0AA39WYJ0_9PEZI|nr:hypothetical protein B0T14DRAFT_191495 [Immersiella caudata]
MAYLNHRLPAPHGRRPHSWVPSTAPIGALDLISRQQNLVSGPTLQPLSAFTIATGLFDAPDAIPFMPGCCSEHDRLRPQPYYESIHGSVYYTPRTPTDQRASPPDSPSFPAPLIQPRQRRPHSIHIVSYPAGFVPHDLRPSPRSPRTAPADKTQEQSKKDKKNGRKESKEEKRQRKAEEKAKREKSEKRRSIRSLPPGRDRVSRVLGKILAVFSITSKGSSPAPVAPAPPKARSRPRPSSFAGFSRRLSRVEPTEPTVVEEPTEATVEAPIPRPVTQPLAQPPERRPEERIEQLPEQPPEHQDEVRLEVPQHPLEQQSEQQPNMATAAAPRPLVTRSSSSANRNSMMSLRSAKHMVSSSVTEVPKPVASGSGLTCSIILAEPNVFLSGLDHDQNTRQGGGPTPSALLRGKLQLNVSKNVKIKSVTLKLVGKARTEWPEGIPPLKVDMFEEQTLRTQSLVFFHAMQEMMWETEYGNQCNYTLKRLPAQQSGLRHSLYSNNSNTSLHLQAKNRHSTSLTAKELKRLSLQSVNSRSFGKGESPLANQVQAKGYKVFLPGTYEYAFELPIDHSQLETTKLQYGSVKWELETTVERAGAFKPNLHGTKEVSIVRLPDQMSLEMTEPISISRQWEDQLHYDIMISGKSFPIGTKIPIAFKLTPLAKVQVHKLKVYVTESIEYWTNDRRVTRKDGGRKILLLEKTAGKPLDKQFNASEIRVISGGELRPDQRVEARRSATARRAAEAARVNAVPDPLPDVSENLLGDLDLGLETFWGSTEIEMNVQIPTCETMAREKALRLHPDCSWKNVNVYHWIKIVMRISRLDPDDPAGKRRRHFEISIDSPFTVLNCRATQANTSLPQYCRGGSAPEQRQQTTCGCLDARVVDRSPSSSTAHLALIEQDAASITGGQGGLDSVASSALPNRPRAAHLQAASRLSSPLPLPFQLDSRAVSSSFDRDRPIHLLRHPSFNPPAFDADDPPPPLPADILTPPPNYDMIVGTPSVDGLADYFARLAVYEGPGQARSRQGSAVIGHDEDLDPLSSGTEMPSGGSLTILENDPFASVGLPGDHAADDYSSDSGEEDPARPHRRGRVNVANPRTPGGRLVPSRSLEIERPVVRLDMTGVIRRGE